MAQIVTTFAGLRSRRVTLTGFSAVIVMLAFLLAACGEESSGQGELWQRHGQLLAWDREVWIIDAVPIIVPAALNVDDQRMLGSQVNARGTFDEHGRMIAEAVTLSTGSLPDATLEGAIHEGVITDVGDSVWIVDGLAVILPDGVSLTAPEGVDPGSLVIPGSIATVTGFHFGENAIIATEIALQAAPRQADANAAEHPPATVETRREPEQPQRDDPEPAAEPEPAPPSNRDRDDDDDDDDDGDDEREERDREKRHKQDEKEREKQQKRDEQERKQQEKQQNTEKKKDEKSRKRSKTPLESGAIV